MDYLLLYEAFESSAISKTVKFLKNKIGAKTSNDFIKSLNHIKQIYDFPIDKISDNNLKYLSSQKAIKINKSEKYEIDNTWNIYCLKFWFSLENGYLGFTGVGDKDMDFNTFLLSERGNNDITSDEVELIENLGIKTGRLTKLDVPYRINHGDQMVGYLSDYNDPHAFVLSKAWIENGQLFAIQDVISGSYPEDSREWREWGNYGWSLGRITSPNNDHHCLYKYIPGDEPLFIEGYDDKQEEKGPSLFDFNLPITNSGALRNWRHGSNEFSINNKGWEVVEKSDFCIVLYLDDMMNPDKARFYEKPSEISKERNVSREGATKLMSDKSIKKENIDRYLTKLIGKMGITKDDMDLKNLQKFISTNLCGDYAAFSIYADRPRNSNISKFGDIIRTIIGSSSIDDKEYYFKKLVDFYKDASKTSNDYKNSMLKNLNIIRESDNTRSIEYFDLMFKIGSYIKDYVTKQNINTIEDINLIYHKIMSIRNVFNDNLFKPNSSSIRNLLSDFSYDLGRSNIEYHLNRTSNHFEEDIIKLQKVEKYVKSILN